VKKIPRLKTRIVKDFLLKSQKEKDEADERGYSGL
jgi:hypothetical protein